MSKMNKYTMLLFATIAYLIIFSTVQIVRKNSEFIYYNTIMLVIFVLLVRYQKKLLLSYSSILGLSFSYFLHMAGGNIYLGETRLYDLWIVAELFKYDNLVHLVSTVVLTLAIYDVLSSHLAEKIVYKRANLYIILILMVMGIGALNEVMEFGAVIFFDAGDRVGDYANNALDLIYNLIGASIGSIIIFFKRDYREQHQEYRKKIQRVRL